MKFAFLLIVLFTLSSSLLFSPSAQAAFESASPEKFLAADNGQSPYEKLKTLFDSATPIQMNQFLKLGDREIANWNCAVAGLKTQTSEVEPYPGVPVLTEADITLVKAVPASGPLFPGSPAQTQRVQMILHVATAYTRHSNSALVQAYQSEKIQLSTSPEVIQRAAYNSTNYQSIYRVINNMMVIKNEEIPASDATTGYKYCYKK